jgi:hypothetical protein
MRKVMSVARHFHLKRQIIVDGVVQLEMAVFVELEKRHASDGF